MEGRRTRPRPLWRGVGSRRRSARIGAAVTLTFRPPTPAEMPEFHRVSEYAFSDTWDPEELEAESSLLPRDRLGTADADSSLVCRVPALAFQTAVPAGGARSR